MTDRQLADCALELLARIKVVSLTGYTLNAVFRNGVLYIRTNFLTKPFDIY